jgi:hypothetical protein
METRNVKSAKRNGNIEQKGKQKRRAESDFDKDELNLFNNQTINGKKEASYVGSNEYHDSD